MRARWIFVAAAIAAAGAHLLHRTTPGMGDGGRKGNRTEEPCAVRKFPLRPPGEGYGVQPWRSEGVRTDRTCHPSQWIKWWYGARSRLVEQHFRVGENAPETAGGAPPDAGWRDEVREALRAGASSKDERFAMQSALALGRGGDARDAAFLAAIVADAKKDGRARAYAALGLGLIPKAATEVEEAQVVAALAGTLDDARRRRDDDLELWCCAAWATGLRASPASLAPLQRAAAEGMDKPRQKDGLHPEVTAAALTAMGLTGLPQFGADLRKGVAPARGPDARATEILAVHAAQGIALLGDRALEPALIDAVKDDRTDVRRAALLALGGLADAKDAPAAAVLAEALRDGDDMPSQVCAAFALARSGHASAPSLLTSAEKNAPALLRQYLHLAMGLCVRRTGDAGLAKLLVDRLEDASSPDERGALCIANGLARSAAAAPHLLDLAKGSGDPQLRAHAACALGLSGAQGAALPVLRELVEQKSSDVLRYEAALALGRLGDASVLEILGDVVLKGKGLANRATAAVCLGRVGGPAAAPVLLRALREEDDSSTLRPCLARALGFLLDRTQGATLGRILEHRNWWLGTEATEEMYLLLD